MSKALIIVDMQRDFMPLTRKVEVHSGSCNDYTGCQPDCGSSYREVPASPLPVEDGLKIVPNIVKEAYSGYDLIVATRDFHPGNHISFKELGGDWPMHCVAGTEGAQILPEIDMIADLVVSKGTDPNKEEYSGFDPMVKGASLTVLGGLLNSQNIRDITIVGVATDYCVLATAMAAIKRFETDSVTVLLDCIAGVSQDTTEDALIVMADEGIELRTRG